MSTCDTEITATLSIDLVEATICFEDGSNIWLTEDGQPMLDEDGNLITVD